MQAENYVILRNKQFRTTRSLFSGTYKMRAFSTADASEVPEPEITTAPLEKTDLMELVRDPEIEGVAPVMPIKLTIPVKVNDAPPDMDKKTTWGVKITGAADCPYDGEGITVAVLDSGIDAGHEAFKGIELVEKDFSGEGNGDADAHGHGTHCAGFIFGRPKDGLRFAVAPGVRRALIGKVFGKNGGGATNQIFNAVLWAIGQGAHIVSMSLGFDFPGLARDLVNRGFPADLATSKALEYYRANLLLFEKLAGMVLAQASFGQGSVLIAAAGNESKRHEKPWYEITTAPPAASEGIISVGAVGQGPAPKKELSTAYFSNTGPLICAPGMDILSAKAGGGYHGMDGTSQAAPHAAGIAALWAQMLKQTTGSVNPKILAARLIGNARREGFAADVDAADIGAGLVRAPMD